MAIEPDWRTLALKVRADRGRMSQTEYAAGLKPMLTQSQISKIETGAMRELPPDVREALVGRFGSIPSTASGQARIDQEIHDLAMRLERELMAELQSYPERRSALLKHWHGQITITRWPVKEERSQPPPDRGAQKPDPPGAARSTPHRVGAQDKRLRKGG